MLFGNHRNLKKVELFERDLALLETRPLKELIK